ncbi:EI24-domain-containing protein [Armillaria solidipes]|uniref:EI24-domain-containing protein n=2 Tax=Armillaria TaxID=47424 RepID=A0A2H3CPD3_9AGAR|nr:EI24-domain-containing protein [Armillaria solidipes]
MQSSQYSLGSIPAHSRHSSRSTYPSFLSVHDTLLLQLNCAWRGLADGFRWDRAVSAVACDAELRANVFKSMMLNSLSLTSIYTFDFLLQPLVRDQQKWLHRNVGWFYQLLWLFPVVSVSLYLNSSWCTTIARRTYTIQHGNRALAQQTGSTYTGMLTAIATSAYRAVMVFTSVVVSFALGYIPYVGPVIGFLFLCWVDSYYCFEFLWIARGMSLSRRIRYLEERWAYYLAFGLPSAGLCTFGSGLANAALFALIFPAFIIMAMYASPVPVDPYNPVCNTTKSRSTSDHTDTIKHPSPFVPIRIPVFAVVLFINDAIVKVLSVRGHSTGRNRAFSDATENAEEGTMEMNTFSSLSQPKRRFKISSRKQD